MRKKKTSSTGPVARKWMSQYLVSPRNSSEPFICTKAQSEFIDLILSFEPSTGERYAAQGVLSLPKGSGKSPFGAALALTWCMAPIHTRLVNGEVELYSLYEAKSPHGAMCAATEQQVRNSFGVFNSIVSQSLIDEYGVNVTSSRVDLPNNGNIIIMSSSSKASEGHPTDFAFIDQTETFSSTSLVNFYESMCRNAAKNGGVIIEAPNAPAIYNVGAAASYDAARSVSEKSLMKYRRTLAAGLSPLLDEAMVYYSDYFTGNLDHLKTTDDVFNALKEAYAGSLEPNGFKTFAELKRLSKDFFSQDDIQTWARFFLNIPGAVDNAWLASDQVESAVRDLPDIDEEDIFTIGFDGARGSEQQALSNEPDHTVITIAAKKRSDPDAPIRFYLHKVWKRPYGSKGPWVPPRDEVIDEISSLILNGINGARCLGCFADSSYWEGDFAFLESQQHVKRLPVSASRKHKVAVVNQDPRSRRMPEVYENVYNDIANGNVFINDDGVLAQYFLACTRKQVPTGYILYKTSKGGEKIDAAIASCLAYAAIKDYESTGAVVKESRGVEKRRMRVTIK